MVGPHPINTGVPVTGYPPQIPPINQGPPLGGPPNYGVQQGYGGPPPQQQQQQQQPQPLGIQGPLGPYQRGNPAAEVEGASRSKAQLIVGIDFVSIGPSRAHRR